MANAESPTSAESAARCSLDAPSAPQIVICDLRLTVTARAWTCETICEATFAVDALVTRHGYGPMKLEVDMQYRPAEGAAWQSTSICDEQWAWTGYARCQVVLDEHFDRPAESCGNVRFTATANDGINGIRELAPSPQALQSAAATVAFYACLDEVVSP